MSLVAVLRTSEDGHYDPVSLVLGVTRTKTSRGTPCPPVVDPA